MYIKDYDKVIDNDYVIFRNKKHIVVVEKDSYDYGYVSDSNIKYEIEIDYSFDNKDIIKILSKQKNIINEKLNKFIKDRSLDLVGFKFNSITDKKRKSTFCDKGALKFADMYGIETPIEVEVEVLETFKTEDSFDECKSEDNIIFGIWLIEDNEIDTTFMWKSTVQVKMCSPDFFDSDINKGSLFVKMRVIT